MESVDWQVRAPLGTPAFWHKWCAWQEDAISDGWTRLEQTSVDPSYRPQYIRGIANDHLELMMRLYSAGAPSHALAPWFDGLLRAWEQSQGLEPSVYPPEIMHSRRTWAVNFDLYHKCAWLISLALVLEIPDMQWQRLLLLMGNEGQDAVLDALIASRQRDRRIGSRVLYPKPYARLQAVILAQPAERPALLRDFVSHWYAELDRKATKGRPALYNRLYWYALGDENFEGGGYFGRWCLEAAAAAKAFKIDDSLCCGHEHYPGDLLRPDGPSIHPSRVFAEPLPASEAGSTPWWRRWFGAK